VPPLIRLGARPAVDSVDGLDVANAELLQHGFECRRRSLSLAISLPVFFLFGAMAQ
jgi:hypothetical protein